MPVSIDSTVLCDDLGQLRAWPSDALTGLHSRLGNSFSPAEIHTGEGPHLMVLSRAYESMQLGSGCKFGAKLIPELPKVIHHLARAHPAEQRLYAGVPPYPELGPEDPQIETLKNITPKSRLFSTLWSRTLCVS